MMCLNTDSHMTSLLTLTKNLDGDVDHHHAEPHSSVGSIADLRTGDCWFDPRLGQIFFPRNDDSHRDRIHCSLTAVHCFNNG